MPEFALTMSQYAWIYLNNSEYDWICIHLKKQNAEYAKILNVCDALLT